MNRFASLSLGELRIIADALDLLGRDADKAAAMAAALIHELRLELYTRRTSG